MVIKRYATVEEADCFRRSGKSQQYGRLGRRWSSGGADLRNIVRSCMNDMGQPLAQQGSVRSVDHSENICYQESS